MTDHTVQSPAGGNGSVPAGPPGELDVLLAIGDENIRRSFEQALRTHKSATVGLVCSDSAEALRFAEESRPDVAIVSTDLTPQDGFATVQEIVARAPGVSVLLVAKNPLPEDFRKALRAGARDMLQIPVEKKELFAAVEAAGQVTRAKRSILEGLASSGTGSTTQPAKRIVVFSTKGGTGKTFLSTTLAAGLAARGRRVALVDLDLQFGDVAIALGLTPERTLYDLVRTYTEFDVALLSEFMLRHPSGLHVLPAPLYPDQAEQITEEDVRMILSVVQQGYEYVIVDTPPFFEERILIALDWADHVLLVASLDLPSVKNLRVSFTTMDLMAYPNEKLHIVMNRAGSKVGLELDDVEKHLGRPVQLAVSSSIEVPRALNAGEVLLLTKPACKVGIELNELVTSFDFAGAEAEDRRRFGLFRKR